MAGAERTWIARLSPPSDGSVAALLDLPLGLDVWERHPGSLVVAAPEGVLVDLERRGLARVDRWATREEYEAQMHDRPTDDDP
ncbi:hypothetical protein OF117_07400 [Geodermatophilus sp. YIM 151500]|uniref:hypothetical protein n=1 Tax=Geodermatophilus sp. YIM 151500 TaxID=2984531 RepID=UPI0021E415F3|nr:hypothetical protein [Geodermatophilus sp. YIM 151500]MCV2489186.1 hypothetical protein [Geodermatophilus sp. YIM 151500]